MSIKKIIAKNEHGHEIVCHCPRNKIENTKKIIKIQGFKIKKVFNVDDDVLDFSKQPPVPFGINSLT